MSTEDDRAGVEHQRPPGAVLSGRWTLQIVEEFEDGYHARFVEHERAVRNALTGGRRHVYENEMKERRRTHGRDGHEARPEHVER